MDVFQAYRYIHQNGDQGGGFYGGVPAVDVVGGVGFGDAELLRLFQSVSEAEAVFHFAQDHVCRGVQDAVKSLEMDCGHLMEKRKDGDAIHDGGFEQEALAFGGCQIAQFSISVDDWAFVGGDGMSSVFEGGAEFTDGRVARFDV